MSSGRGAPGGIRPVPRSYKETFVYLPPGRRTFPVIKQSHFHHPDEHGKIIILFLMIMPGFYHPGIGGSDVYLTETAEDRIIAP